MSEGASAPLACEEWVRLAAALGASRPVDARHDRSMLADPGLQNTNPAATLRVGPIDLVEPELGVRFSGISMRRRLPR